MKVKTKFNSIVSRFKEVEAELSKPDVVSDIQKFTELNKEYAELRDVVALILEYQAVENDINEYKEIMQDKEADQDLKELAQAELPVLEKSLPKMEEKIKIALIPKDAADDKNVIIELRAGTGGDEAALFVLDLFKSYNGFAESQGWKVEVLSQSLNDIGGAKEITASIKGESVYAKMKFESGTHRVQRVPQTETQGRVHTSAITVAILPEMQEVDIDIKPSDLKIDTFRASGAGGQHVNTTDSAIRITHIPTKTVVECQDERSQHKNKAKALKILYAKVYEKQQEELNAERAENRKSQVGSGDRSERIRTYNYPQGRVTDHRIGMSLYNLPVLMSTGEGLSEIITALQAEEQALKLANLVQE